MIDSKLKKLIKTESERQEGTIDLIPSENLVSPEILEILGSPLVNKYSEGYPGKRYYPGNKNCDEIEEIAKEYALTVFGLSDKKWRANVQPYSGSPANLAVYLGLLKPGEVMMGMKLAHGGHLTHGHSVSATGKFFKSVQYGTNEKGFIDYEEVRKLALEYRPKVIVSGTTAYPRKIDFKKFGEIADEVGAYHLADISHISGLIAAGAHLPPFKYAHVVTSTTHKTLRGPRGAVIWSRIEPLKEGDGIIADAIDKAVFPGLQGGPHNNQTAAIAQAFYEISKPSFKKYGNQITANARALAKSLIGSGFDLVTGGTDNHLILIDLKNIGLLGMEAQEILERNGIIANRNTVPGDKSPFKPTGIRMGTPSVTTRGMKEKQMDELGRIIALALKDGKDVSKSVTKLTTSFSAKKFLTKTK
ncbi:MAG: serine hydroxymethyltransferase [Candidatus Colwellbacteria bacterium]|nr:serine hydroxymethyltransferase [Candidatus Colwellbacteria bacterium]